MCCLHCSEEWAGIDMTDVLSLQTEWVCHLFRFCIISLFCLKLELKQQLCIITSPAQWTSLVLVRCVVMRMLEDHWDAGSHTQSQTKLVCLLKTLFSQWWISRILHKYRNTTTWYCWVIANAYPCSRQFNVMYSAAGLIDRLTFAVLCHSLSTRSFLSPCLNGYVLQIIHAHIFSGCHMGQDHDTASQKYIPGNKNLLHFAHKGNASLPQNRESLYFRS